MDYGTTSASSLGAGAQINSAPKQTAMQEHSARLHDQATKLAQCNERLRNLTARVFGPEPESENKEANQPQPTGVLYVAQFGAERISMEIDRLANSISKLEQVA